MAVTVYKNANIGGELTDITVENGRFSNLQKNELSGIDLKGARVFAGLIDVHAHGCMNIEANSGRIDELSRFEALHGTTAWLPTTATVAIEDIYIMPLTEI